MPASMAPVIVSFGASAFLPSGVFPNRLTGANPSNAAIFVGHCTQAWNGAYMKAHRRKRPTLFILGVPGQNARKVLKLLRAAGRSLHGGALKGLEANRGR